MTGVHSELVSSDAQAIDDCWNRIGIHGDRSCPLLVEHIHCRNCSVYSAAATRLLDRYALAQEQRVSMHSETLASEVKTRSIVVFRLGEEWLGLLTRCLAEVSPMQAIHSLPHQRSRALLGVANVRGALVACLSFVELLGLDSSASSAPAARAMPRMLVICADGGPVVVPVDEVDGIYGIEVRLLDGASAPAHNTNARFTRGVVQWRNRSLRLLDEEQLLSAVNRSLT
ncbi:MULTISPECIES: chemotaxis protein CheW [unclassified Pseudomonas]|uniref:chemotaxis protein CheW n=1 Tax=unclassified Pseudomonas TaxID=196821 RepID=UPI0025F5C594|nr:MULTISPECIES: chemotaxis protein CheW [unclassified Pseudomonas]